MLSCPGHLLSNSRFPPPCIFSVPPSLLAWQPRLQMTGERRLVDRLMAAELAMLEAVRDGSALLMHMEDCYYTALLKVRLPCFCASMWHEDSIARQGLSLMQYATGLRHHPPSRRDEWGFRIIFMHPCVNVFVLGTCRRRVLSCRCRQLSRTWLAWTAREGGRDEAVLYRTLFVGSACACGPRMYKVRKVHGKECNFE